MKYILWNMKVGCKSIGIKNKALVTYGSIVPKGRLSVGHYLPRIINNKKEKNND